MQHAKSTSVHFQSEYMQKRLYCNSLTINIYNEHEFCVIVVFDAYEHLNMYH